MNKDLFRRILTHFLSFWDLRPNESLLNKELKKVLIPDQAPDITGFAQFLNRISAKFEFVFKHNKVNQQQFEEILNTGQPVIGFVSNYLGEPIPCLIRKKGLRYQITVYGKSVTEEIEEKKILLAFSHLKQDEHGEIEILSGMPVSPNFSNTTLEWDDFKTQKLTPLRRFFLMLRAERRDIYYLYVYGILVSALSLSLPLGLQAIINFISGGSIFRSLILLIGVVVGGILFTGLLQIMQMVIVEYIQRRLFVRAAFEFAFRIPKIKLESLAKYYPPELMNRFFDIINVQKGLSKTLLTFISSSMQVLFSLTLLSFYHPFFVFFGFFMLLAVVLIFFVTGPVGLKTSLVESKYKYKMAEWLEEVARTQLTFKLAGSTTFPLDKTDQISGGYLYARKKHFKIIIDQSLYLVVFKTLITAALLIIGGQLVIDGNLNIGQFVAAEIIIILLVSSIEKLIGTMESIYDLLTAVEKLGAVTDLPLEPVGQVLAPSIARPCGFNIKLTDLSYKFPNSDKYTLNQINAQIYESERVCLSGLDGSGKTTLLKLIAGMYHEYTGSITFNNVSLREIDIASLRDIVGSNLSSEDIFEGTIYENISLGIPDITPDMVAKVCESLGIAEFISRLPEGYQTPLLATGKGLSGVNIKKMIMARALAKRRQILFVQDFFTDFPKKDREAIFDQIFASGRSCTTIVLSNDPQVMQRCDRVFYFNKGSILFQGTYSEMPEDYVRNII